MLRLTATDVARARLHSLLLHDAADATPLAVVTWFGAMQAQDLASGKWSLGIRLPGTTEPDVDAALSAGDVLRTWPMRGTIHLVPPADAHWMLETTGVRALAAGATRREQLGIGPGVADAAAGLLQQALSGGRRLTRAQCLAMLAASGIDTSGQRGYHLLGHAAVIGVTCLGPTVDGQQTFELLDEWAPRPVRLGRREAVAELAWRYFRSHGPATERDFAGWTGLTLSDTRSAIADNAGRLVSADVAGRSVVLSRELEQLISDGGIGGAMGAAVPPGFDEFMLGYKDRSVQVEDGRMDDIVPGRNGVFRATVVLDGRVVGSWTRTVRARRVDVRLALFRPLPRRSRTQLDAAFGRYGDYLGIPVSVSE